MVLVRLIQGKDGHLHFRVIDSTIQLVQDKDVTVKLVPSTPPEGKKRIQNIYWDPKTLELVIEVEE